MVSVESVSGDQATQKADITRMQNGHLIACDDVIAVEEPLELQLRYGPRDDRVTRSISVTMRTPGNDQELVAGFLLTEGILTDAAQIESIQIVQGSKGHEPRASRNTLRVTLEPSVQFNLGSLERNFYTTSSCGICGKASLLAIRSVCPPRAPNRLTLSAETLQQLPALLRARQQAFEATGGIHACGLFDAKGQLLALREDVGRHNACDKLIGREFLADRTPLRDCILLLSGRASFELLQKSVMAGVSAVVSVGAPSSMAVEIAREFDVTLVGFLREQSFNIYHGADRVETHPVRKDLR
ncbi:formate dehydrogenase accessory sulfurtransferase FdhD [Terriglobus aquaticus]|uniref:Sulfur carrier protein FdhD n=1 Tax=Terriglobus aquaticus TaxID=940139 RepID=A0ABW9KKD0_9BACT|nr:formate dehydrogenase accessory sulfurtransferase FdhD [Terriglobus aquaticus]